MGRMYQERRVYDRPQAEVRAAAERAVYELGLDIKPGATEFEVRADRTMSTFSWGERTRVLMATAPGGGTQVLIESRLVFGLFDWGRNEKNVEAMFNAMAPVIGAGEVVPVEV